MRKIRVIPIMIIMVTLMSSCRIDEGDTMKERARYENEIGRIYNQKEDYREEVETLNMRVRDLQDELDLYKNDAQIMYDYMDLYLSKKEKEEIKSLLIQKYE